MIRHLARSALDGVRPHAAPLAGLLVVLAAVCRRLLLGRDVLWHYDIAIQDVPNRVLLREALHAGDLGRMVWNPEIFTGFPLFAEAQAAPAYPPNWLAVALFPALTAYSLLLVFHFAVAGTGTYAFLRALGRSRAAAWLGALAFMFSGHLVGAMLAGQTLGAAVWLPWALWCVERHRATGRRHHLALATLVLGLSWLAGYPHSAILCALVFGLYFFFTAGIGADRPWRAVARSAGPLALIGAATAALAAVVLLPLAELSALTPRSALSYEAATRISLPPAQLVTLVWPYAFLDRAELQVWSAVNAGRTAVYFGLVPLVLALWAVALRARRDRRVAFFALLALAGLVVAMGGHTPLYRLVYRLPLSNRFRTPALYGYLFNIATAVLAAYGFDALATATRIRRRLLGASAAACLAAGGLVALLVGVVRRAHRTGALVDWIGSEPELLNPLLDSTQLYRAMLASTRLDGATVLVPLAVSALAAALFLAGRRSWRWPVAAGLLALTAIDLAFFGSVILGVTTAPVADARAHSPALAALPPNAVEDPYRVAVTFGIYPILDAHRPNRLMVDGVPTFQGYTPLSTNRSFRYLLRLQEAAGDEALARMLGVANARYGLDGNTVTLAGVPVTPHWPLAVVGWRRGAPWELAVPAGARWTDARLVLAVNMVDPVLGEPFGRLTIEGADGGKTVDELRLDGAFGAPGITVERLDDAATTNPYMWHAADNRPKGALVVVRLPDMDGSTVRSLRLASGRQLTTLYVLGFRAAGADGPFTPRALPFEGAGFRRVSEADWAWVYENERALPRVLVVDEVVPATAETALDAVADPGFDARRQVVLEEPLPAHVAAMESGDGQLDATWRFESYNPLAVRVRAAASKPAILVLADQHYPGWSAYLDGRQVPVLVANAMFRAVAVPAGEHVVEFRYQPAPLRLGATISVAAWLVLGALAATWATRGTAAG